MICHETISKFFISLSWGSASSQKQLIRISNNNFIIKFLSALSFSEHRIKVTEKGHVLSPEVEANIKELSRLWQTAQESMAQGKFIASRNALRKIIEIDNYNAAAYNRLGILYATRKDYNTAIYNFEIAASMEPSAAAMNNLGLINYEATNYNDALKYFKKASKLDPSSAKRYIPIALTYQKMSKDKLCLKHFDLAVKNNPNVKLLKFIYSFYRANDYSREAERIKILISERSRKFSADTRINKDVRPSNDISLSSFMSYYV